MGIDSVGMNSDWTKGIVPSIVPVVIISAVALVSQTVYSRISLTVS